MKKEFIDKKTQWIIAWYLLIGVIYALYQFIKPLFYEPVILKKGIIGFKLFLTDLIFYPIILLIEKVFGGFIGYEIYWYLLLITVGIYLIHYILESLKLQILPNEIKHLVIISVSLVIFISTLSYTIDYNERQILEKSNFRTIISNFNDKALSDEEYYNGFYINNELKVYLIDEEYMKKVYDDKDNDLIPLGLMSYGINTIHINYEGIKNYTNGSTEYDSKLSNTLIHEITHYIDNKGYIVDRCGDYGFTGVSCGVVNEKKYEDLFDRTYKDIPIELRQTVNFTRIYNGTWYRVDEYDNEIVARINALCLIPDEERNFNNVKVANYSMCKEFKFQQSTIDEYDKILESLTLNYAETFYGEKKPLYIRK